MVTFHPERWPEMVAQHEIRECRLCESLIANDRAWGRAPSKDDSNLCEVCQYDQCLLDGEPDGRN